MYACRLVKSFELYYWFSLHSKFHESSPIFFRSCEPSPESHIRIVEVLVTSEWSGSQAAPGKVCLLSESSGTVLNVMAADCRGFNSMVNEGVSGGERTSSFLGYH